MNSSQKRQKELNLIILFATAASIFIVLFGGFGIYDMRMMHGDFDAYIIVFFFMVATIAAYIYVYRVLKKYSEQISNQEQELLGSNIRLEYAISGTGDGLWDWDILKDEVYFSPQWKEMLGFEDDELPSEFASWKDRVHPEDLQTALQEITNAHTDPEYEYNTIHRLRHKDGSWVWILDRGQTIFDENKKAVRMVGFHTDITIRKNQEMKIKELSALLTNTMNSVKNLIFVKNSDLSYVECNEAFINFMGKPKEEILGKNDYELFDKDVADFFREKDESMLRSGNQQSNYEWVDYPDGSKKYLLTLKAPLKDEKGNTIGLVGHSVDMTKHKQLEEDLLASQKLFVEFMEHMPANIYILEEDRIIYTNKTDKAFFDKKNIVARMNDDVSVNDKEELIQKLFQQVQKNGFYEDIVEIEDHLNEKRVYREFAFKIDTNEKSKVGLVSIDITKEYQSNNEIKRVLSAFERSNISVVMTDLNGDIEYVNSSWCRITGYTREELIGQNPRIVKSGYVSDETYRKMWKQLTSGKIWNSEIKNIAKDGTAFWEESTIMPSFDKKGDINGYISFKVEINDKMRLREELAQKDEMMLMQSRHAAMGEMISMIAHQWRQPISVISMNAANILVDIELNMIEKEGLKEISNDIIEQTQELSKTIDDFRDFFKPDKTAGEVYVKQIIDDALGVIGRSLSNNNIAISINISESLEIKTYSRELMQVFLNIIKNAKEALEGSAQSEKMISLTVIEEGENIEIRILDNAGGIKEAIVKKIFDPYFTTKDVKNGTGLGLYISKTIVEQHLEGVLSVESFNNSTCFSIKIPMRIKNV